jgi:hypothetical protein
MTTNTASHPDSKSLFDYLDLFQLFVPPPLQLARYQTISRVHRIVLFKGLLRLILQLLQFAG